MKIALATDHGGFFLKEKIKTFLINKGHNVIDFGAEKYDENDDFVDFCLPAALAISSGELERAILLCKNGVGMSILSNKIKKVRCGLCMTPKQTERARNDDDINALAIASEYLKDEEAFEIIETFLKTPFSAKERYVRRLKEIGNVESRQ